MGDWRFSVPRILRNDGVAVAGQVVGVLAALAGAMVWLLRHVIWSDSQPLVHGVVGGLAGLVLICAVSVALRILVLARRFSRALIVQADAELVHDAAHWLPLGHRARYPLRVCYEVAGQRHTCDLLVLDAAAFQRIERQGFADVVVDPEAAWEAYAADLYLVRDAE